jgi:hypothetical protein
MRVEHEAALLVLRESLITDMAYGLLAAGRRRADFHEKTRATILPKVLLRQPLDSEFLIRTNHIS